MKHKLELILLGEISINREVDDVSLMAESEELKSILMKIKREE